MVDPPGNEMLERRQADGRQDQRHRGRLLARQGARRWRQRPAMAGMSQSIGQTVRISRSAKAVSVKVLNSRNRPARPASISRDQCVS